MPAANRTYRLPSWRLPPGVAPGTYEYTQRESIANDYADFLKHTPLISLDVEIMLRSLPAPALHRKTSVLDFGCGDGRALNALWQEGYEVLGIDLSQPMLTKVADQAYGDQLSTRLVRANLVQLEGLADSIADHAVCLFSTIGMIRGRNYRRQFLAHAARLIRPAGILVLHVHNRNHAWRDQPSAMGYLKSAWHSVRSPDCELGDRTYAYRGLADMFLHTYSLGELRRDLRSTGWRLRRVVSLSTQSDALLRASWLVPSLRAGGFIAIATR